MKIRDYLFSKFIQQSTSEQNGKGSVYRNNTAMIEEWGIHRGMVRGICLVIGINTNNLHRLLYSY